MIRRPRVPVAEVAKPGEAPALSRAEVLRQLGILFPGENARKATELLTASIVAEREQAMQRARDLDAELRALGVGIEDAPSAASEPARVALPAEGEVPSADWSVLRLVKHYLRSHPSSQAGPLIEFVLSVRPGEDTTNVNSILYKYSKPGRVLKKTGDRGNYRYSLREANGEG